VPLDQDRTGRRKGKRGLTSGLPTVRCSGSGCWQQGVSGGPGRRRGHDGVRNTEAREIALSASTCASWSSAEIPMVLRRAEVACRCLWHRRLARYLEDRKG
jgi:hypothetical protein